ncbi:MAG TPA: hypothetical protein VGI29_05190 [Candidatus Binataceae bacterium]|jgi:hypothetical protein
MKRPGGYASIVKAFVRRWALAALAIAAIANGCFYPPTQKPPAPSKDEVTIDRPYDMVWDAVHSVIKENKLRVNADDPNQGIIETETDQFTLAEADCGQLKDIGGKHAAEPDRAATAVYFFKIRPAGHESSIVSVQATFSAPLYVALHPPRNVQCVSRGKAEARLLEQIAEQAAAMHRPTFAKPSS